jgi:hypothetical protein
MLKAQNLEAYCNFENNIITKHTILQIEQLMFDTYKLDWKNRVSAYSQGNKLRTYKLFKQDFCTEPYLEYKMPLKYRSAYAKFRCGVAPLRVETGRYERKAVHERTCL